MDSVIASRIALVFAVLGILVYGPNTRSVSIDLVSVSIADHEILNDLATAFHVNVSRIPGTVQVPILVAAQVCEVKASRLRKSVLGGAAICEAMTISSDFMTAVRRQLIPDQVVSVLGK
jgi:hypothetical protein